jgi:multidrug resistance efflux pump
MNIVTINNPSHLTADISLAMGGLEGLRYEARITRSMLDKAKADRARTWRYRGPDAFDFRCELSRRIDRCRKAYQQARAELDQAEQVAALRNAQAAQTSTLAAHQVAYCIKELSKVEAGLNRLSLSKPAPDDFYARILMRDAVAGVRDLLLNVAAHSISISH